MAHFQLGSQSTTSNTTPAYDDSPAQYFSDDEDDELTLPFPGELPRNDFLVPNFDPQIYLSSLRNRHQTLEDLRSDLRQRSQLLNKELLDLVNGNYEAFLGLGSNLKGGEERVEGVRVGLLGFQREVEGIRRAVQERAVETGDLLWEKKRLRRDAVTGRALLEIDEKIGELEETLGITAKEGIDDEEFDTDDDFDGLDLNGSTGAVGTRRLQRHAEQYMLVTHMVDRVGADHPFLVAQRPRLGELRKTLLLDLSATLRQAKGSKEPRAILVLTKIFGDLGAETEALRVLKGG